MCDHSNNYMHKRGMTLIELTVAMTLSAILLLVMTVQFVANLKFQNVIGDKVAVAQEAEVAVYNMTQVLRFAMPNPPSPGSPPSNTDTSGQGYSSSITVTIEKGHLSQYPAANTIVEYGLSGSTLYYLPWITSTQAGVPVPIATGITTFNSVWNGAPSNNFTISLTAQKNNETINLNTTIQTLL